MKKNKTKRATKLSTILAVIMLFALIFSLAGCGSGGANQAVSSNEEVEEEQDDKEKTDKEESDEEESDEEKDEDAKKDESEADTDKKEDTTPTAAPVEDTIPTTAPTEAPTPTTAPAEETLPTLEELIDFNSDTQNLSQNYKAEMNMVFSIGFGDTPDSMLSMDVNAKALSYENVSSSDVFMVMELMGTKEETQEKEYIVKGADGLKIEYTYYEDEDTWYKTEYVEVEDEDDDSLVGGISELDASQFNVLETTSDDDNIYITATAGSDMELDGMDIIGSFGVDNVDFTITCEFVFDKDTHQLVSMKLICEYGDIPSEDLAENGITSISIDEFEVIFMPNNTPVSHRAT